MIIKERNPEEHGETDKFSVAGAKAEEQMAFYLKRAFADDPNVYVFNDIRLQGDDDDAAQIDHLVLHRHGFVIVESKSVSTGVAVNEHGEWVRPDFLLVLELWMLVLPSSCQASPLALQQRRAFSMHSVAPFPQKTGLATCLSRKD